MVCLDGAAIGIPGRKKIDRIDMGLEESNTASERLGYNRPVTAASLIERRTLLRSPA